MGDDDSDRGAVTIVNDAESSGSDGEVIVNNGQNTDRNVIIEQCEEESKGENESDRKSSQQMMTDPQENKGAKEDSSVSTIREKDQFGD